MIRELQRAIFARCASRSKYHRDVAIPARGVLEVRSSDAEHAIAVYNPLVLAHFTRRPTDAELALIQSLTDEAIKAGVVGGMLLVAARRNVAGGIDPRVRKFFEHMVRENAAHFGASATVVRMQGFGGSLMRSFLTGLLLLSNKRKLLQVFANVDEACRWLAPQHELDPKELLRAYERATEHLTDHA
jgi:hypothetical protein